MEGKISSTIEFGGSLPVENVQELASHNLKDLPQRYIQTEFKLENVSIDVSLQIPVIDMNKLTSEHSKGYNTELDNLHLACRDWGFFRLINHGAVEAIEEMKIVTKEFFKLPFKEKINYAQQPNNIEGYGQAFVVSEDQKLDWGDMLFLRSLPVSQRKIRFWPNTPINFRSTLHKYAEELHKISLRLYTWMAINLGIEPEKLVSEYENCIQGIRMNYYPPCVHSDKVIGLTPHSDATGITLLVQVNQVQGLQIKKDGKWIPIEPISDAIIVNIGDVMEIMSNGEYSSIEHRAVVNSEKERLSMAAFHSPNTSTSIGPLPDLVKTTSDQKYKRLSHEDFIRLAFGSKLDGKSLLDHMKIKK